MAPEVQERSGYDTRADIWSLVLLLIEMAPKEKFIPTGFDEEGSVVVTFAPDLWPPMKEFFRASLKTDPAERPNAARLVQQLTELQAKAARAFPAEANAAVPPRPDRAPPARPAPYKCCLVCLDAPRAVRLPCGHGVLCQACGERLKSSGGSCPVCRKKFDHFAPIQERATFVQPKPQAQP